MSRRERSNGPLFTASSNTQAGGKVYKQIKGGSVLHADVSGLWKSLPLDAVDADAL